MKESEAVLPVTYREVQYSFSVYEALRVLKGHVVHLDDHLRRLAFSCGAIHLSHPFDDGMIASSIEALIKADSIEDATMRILIVGGNQPLFFITYTDLLSYPESYYSDGIDCTLYHGERFLPEAKTSNLLMQYIALEDAKRKGAFEALLVNRNGLVLEGTRSNFYGLAGSKLYTAPDNLVLSGITRISVLKAAKAIGLENCVAEQLRGENETGKYDFVVSRAVMPLPELVNLVKKNVASPQHNSLPNGLLCLKGGNITNEIKPYKKIADITDLGNIFEEEWFKQKFMVYIPL